MRKKDHTKPSAKLLCVKSTLIFIQMQQERAFEMFPSIKTFYDKIYFIIK